MEKVEKIKKETERLENIFKNCEDAVKDLISGLIAETAFLAVELQEMREVLGSTGMLKIHPTDLTKQKSLPISNEYRRTLNIYALNIKVLNSILKNVEGFDEDEFSKWIKSKEKQHEI